MTTETSIYEMAWENVNHDYIAKVAAPIRAALESGLAVEIDYQPGDMTRYELVFTPLRSTLVVGGRRAFQGVEPKHAVVVSIGNHFGGAYALNLLGRHPKDYIHPSYVSEHWLGREENASAAAISLLLEAVAGVESYDPTRTDG